MKCEHCGHSDFAIEPLGRTHCPNCGRSQVDPRSVPNPEWVDVKPGSDLQSGFTTSFADAVVRVGDLLERHHDIKVIFSLRLETGFVFYHVVPAEKPSDE